MLFRTFSEKKAGKYTFAYTVSGCLFGLCFPVCALLFDIIILGHKSISFSGLLEAHKLNPLHYIIDAAPLSMGLAFGLAGYYKDKFLMVYKKLRDLEDEGKDNHLSTIVETSKACILSLDRNYTIIAGNSVCRELFEHVYGVELTRGNNIKSLLEINADLIFLYAGFNEALKGDTYLQTNSFQSQAQGNKYYEFTYNPIRSSNNEVIGASLLAIDITDRIIRENMLREKGQQLAAFIEYSPASMAMLDKDLNYIAVSKRWKEAFYELPAALEGKSHTALFPYLTSRLNILQMQALQGEKIVGWQEAINSPGKAIEWLEWQLHPWFEHENEIGGIILSAQFITDKKLAEARILEKSQLLNGITANMPVTVFKADAKGIITHSYGAGLWNLTFSDGELAGKSIFDHLPLFRDELTHVYNGNYTHFVNKLSAKDEYYFQYFLFPDTYTQDGIFGFSIDVTESKRGERKLIEAKELAEEAAKIKSDFLSNMSHEIRTPMNAVIGLTHLLIEQNPRPDQVELLKVLEFSSKNLLSLINDILDLQKIEAGKIVFEKVGFHLQDLIDNIIQTHKFKAVEKGIELLAAIDPDVPATLQADVVRLSQILNNLLSNGVKFTDKGTVKLQVQIKEQAGQELLLYFAITDTGVGIAKDKIETIFDAFEQAEADTTRKYGGTGLGLSISKRLIELQGGQIGLDSVVGKGSCFYFTLPVRQASTPAGKNELIEGELHEDLSNINLLLVEDNLVNVLVVKKFLQKWNIHPDHAENGREALQKVQAKPYDLILMDLQMPVMNGLEASQAIRALKGNFETLPIIALTADVSADVHHKITAAGMNSYLSKPFDQEKLYTTIYSLVARHRAGSATRKPEVTGNESQIYFTRNTTTEVPRVDKLEKIYTLAQGDASFVQDMLLASVTNLFALETSFRQAIESRDSTALGSMIHKYTSLINLLELKQIQNLLEEGRSAVTTNTGTTTSYTYLTDNMHAECALIIAYLQHRLYEMA